jgi:hypothetical protein
MANGILVVPEEKELIKRDEFGIKYPKLTPYLNDFVDQYAKGNRGQGWK